MQCGESGIRISIVSRRWKSVKYRGTRKSEYSATYNAWKYNTLSNIILYKKEAYVIASVEIGSYQGHSKPKRRLRMKRFAYVLLGSLFILSLSTSVLAFEGVELGFKGGLNLAKTSGETYIDDLGDVEFESKAGIGLGAFISININQYFAIQPEILYMQKGGQKDMPLLIDVGGGQLVNVDVEMDANLNYLEIPILAKVKVPTGSSITPFFIVGPAVAFNIDAEAEITVSADINGYFEESAKEDIKDEITDTDLGIIFGGGAEFGLGAVNIFFDVRYNIGMLNIDDIGVNDIKNRAISFMTGISFPLQSQ